jgi:hypothetical protein
MSEEILSSTQVTKGKNLPEVELCMSRKESGSTAVSIGVWNIFFQKTACFSNV